MSTQINLTPQLYQYYLDVSLREPDTLQKMRVETRQMSAGKMQITPEQGQFMGLLVELLNAKKTLDIGTFTGYSALVVALALPAEGVVVACDVSEEWTTLAKRYWQAAGVAKKIDLHIAPALQTLQKLIDEGQAGSFDFAFIDADKENYAAYYEKALTLLRTGGLIAIDNVLWGGSVADSKIQDAETQAIRALNSQLHNDKRVTLSLVPIGDGLTLARKR